MTARLALLAALLLALLAAPAGAQDRLILPQEGQGGAATATPAGELGEVVEALRQDPVHVDPDAENAITEQQAARLRDRIAARDAGPLYIAIVPGDLRNRTGGDADALLREIAVAVRRPGAYAIVAGNSFRAGATGGVGLDGGAAGDIATTAIERRRDAGVYATLGEFVDLIGEAKRTGGDNPVSNTAPGAGGAGALGVLALMGAGFGLAGWHRRRKRRKEVARQVEELRETARDDLVALGDDVRALDLDVQMPGVAPDAVEHYGKALGHYERAEGMLDKAGDPADFGPIGEELEQGRYAMAAAKARLEGRPAPERRPPCFFDPRHGPSTRDVEWAPDGYQARPVPVCEADAVRLETGQDPLSRQITVGGRQVPMYDAPGYYAPYAGGYFGGFTGFLPGLLFGSMLGSGFGMMGPAVYGAGGYAGGGDDFGFGGGGGGGFDLGDFGGGGGLDFGGGDFGGGGGDF